MGSSRQKVNWMALRKDYERREGSSLGSMRRIAVFEGTSSRGSRRVQPIRPLVKPSSARPFRGTAAEHRTRAEYEYSRVVPHHKNMQSAIASGDCEKAFEEMLMVVGTYASGRAEDERQSWELAQERSQGFNAEGVAREEFLKACVKPRPRGMFSGRQRRR